MKRGGNRAVRYVIDIKKLALRVALSMAFIPVKGSENTYILNKWEDKWSFSSVKPVAKIYTTLTEAKNRMRAIITSVHPPKRRTLPANFLLSSKFLAFISL